MQIDQLIKCLLEWPPDAQVEISVNPYTSTPFKEEGNRVWFELIDVEKPYKSLTHKNINKHCLLIAGKVTMWETGV